MVDVAGGIDGKLDRVAEAERGVARGPFATGGVPARELGEEDAERRGLDRIEP